MSTLHFPRDESSGPKIIFINILSSVFYETFCQKSVSRKGKDDATVTITSRRCRHRDKYHGHLPEIDLLSQRQKREKHPHVQGTVGKRETGESAAHVAEQSQTTILLYMFCTEKTTFQVTDALNNIQGAAGKRETDESAAHVGEQSQTTILLYMFCTAKRTF
jgi:hypothetical protein